MASLVKFFAVAATLVSAATSQAVLETGVQPELSFSYLQRHAPPSKCQFRLPPTFYNPPFSPPSWEGTPGAWFQGTWYFSATNQPTYLDLFEEIQWTLHSIGDPNNSSPTNLLHDLTTGFYKGTTTEWLIYGVDTPFAPDAYVYVPTGHLAFANNTWEILAWGYDTESVPFAVVYETEANQQTTDTVDFISRSKAGISAETFDYLKKGLVSLGDAHLTDLVAAVELTPQSDGRDGQPYPSCDAVCQTNGKAPFSESKLSRHSQRGRLCMRL